MLRHFHLGGQYRGKNELCRLVLFVLEKEQKKRATNRIQVSDDISCSLLILFLLLSTHDKNTTHVV